MDAVICRKMPHERDPHGARGESWSGATLVPIVQGVQNQKLYRWRAAHETVYTSMLRNGLAYVWGGQRVQWLVRGELGGAGALCVLLTLKMRQFSCLQDR